MRHYRRTEAQERHAEARKQWLKAWRKREEAARLAIQPAPPDLLPGDQWMQWTLQGIGWAADVRLLIPPNNGRNRPRSDQFTLVVDDQVIGPRMGMSSILSHLQAKVIPRQATRQQRHEISHTNYRA